MLLILFAFLAGIVTILSPCILPVLPIVLSGTVGGKDRPFGIVVGFICSFTFFTLFLSSLVRLFGIPAEVLRTASVIIMIGFGLVLLIPQTQRVFERLVSKLSGLSTAKPSKQGFWGGILLGVSLGLVWTPCVGPILASVITLAATSTVNTQAILITLAYAVGTAIPMLAIIYGGQKLLQKVPRISRYTPIIQKAFGVLMIVTAVAILTNYDRKFQTYVLETFPQYGTSLTKFEDNPFIQQDLQSLNETDGRSLPIDRAFDPGLARMFPQAPELIAGGDWFNTDPLTLQQLRGKVVLVDFWTYTCINCIRTLPYLREWHRKYPDKGLVIIGVHTPEFEFEKNSNNVTTAIKDFGIEYPVMQDNEYATWQAYSNRYWPAKYFIDKDGKIRATHFGEGDYDQSEQLIQQLLAETGVDAAMPIENPEYQIQARTPELYLGFRREEALASPERIKQYQLSQYSFPQQLPANRFALSGQWLISGEFAQPSADGKLQLNFESKEVYLVMKSTGGVVPVQVLLDGQPVSVQNAGEDVTNGEVNVSVDRLYKLIKLETPGRHTVELIFPEGSVEAYAFTFG